MHKASDVIRPRFPAVQRACVHAAEIISDHKSKALEWMSQNRM